MLDRKIVLSFHDEILDSMLKANMKIEKELLGELISKRLAMKKTEQIALDMRSVSNGSSICT